MKLLITDDHPEVRDMLGDYFSVRGFEVRTVSDGLECLAVAQTFKPDIILLDIKMKRIDGDKIILDLLTLLPETKILVITGNQDESLKNKVLKLGVHGYYEKPVSIISIAEKIKAMQEEAHVR